MDEKYTVFRLSIRLNPNVALAMPAYSLQNYFLTPSTVSTCSVVEKPLASCLMHHAEMMQSDNMEVVSIPLI